LAFATPLRILVVDDEFLIAALIEDLLVGAGADVVGPAAEVDSALAMIEQNEGRLDGAMLDVNLNGQLVYPVAQALAARGTPFVFMTGYRVDTIDQGHGATASFEKPISKEAINRALILFERYRSVKVGEPEGE
jgi:CheY-like chemotaxis protein